MVAIELNRLLRKQRKAELIALLTQIALKGRSWRSCSCFAASASVDTIPNAVRSQLSTKFFSALRLLNLVRMVFRLLVLGLPTRQFEGFVYVAITRKRTRTLSGSISRKIGKMFQNGGFVGFWIQKGALV